MKLYNSKYDFSIELMENVINCIVIENEKAYADVIKSVEEQIASEEGDFILSDCEKILPLSKNAVFISNPFAVNCNEKRIINRLYQELQEIVLDEFISEYGKIQTDIITFIDKIADKSPYDLQSSIDVNFQNLLKLCDVKIEESGESLLEKIINYLRVMKRIGGIQVLFTLNLKFFLDFQDITYLYEFCFYEKIYIIDIEGIQTKQTGNEHYLIIDKDLCQIVI